MHSTVIRCALLLATCWATVSAQVAVIHTGIDDHDLGPNRVRDMFLGRITTWRDGSPVVIVFVDTPADEAELRNMVGRDLSLLLRGWKRLVYAGGGAMPLIASSQAEALELITKHHGAIAIMAKIDPDPRIHIISLDPTATRVTNPGLTP